DKKKHFQPLLDYWKEKVPEIGEARLSNRLKESAVCLVTEEWAPGAHLERVMQRMGRADELPKTKRILEVNAEHPAIVAMRQLHEKNTSDPRLENYVWLLYDQAVIAEGTRLKNPGAFARRINELLAKDAGG